MTKYDFLDTLRRTLNGNMNASTVDEHIRFYDSYFISEAAKGRSEADILNNLGDPRILARTLIDAAERAGDPYAQNMGSTDSSDEHAYSQRSYGQRSNSQSSGSQSHGYEQTGVKKVHMPGWLLAVLACVILVVVIQVVGTIVFALLPYMIPVVIVVYVIKLIRRG